ncbi:MAG: hypothetical protein HGA22_01950, partial [Clostridiales bacterium]|nr:hypothetical protein [Clostridiales bacterium]
MSDRKMSEAQLVNRLISGLYATVSLILVVSYLIEVLHKSRTPAYFLTLFLILLIPGIINAVIQVRNHESTNSKYVLLIGYFLMYCFTMFTAKTQMGFC